MQHVAKLHDPVGKPGQHNLSVDYVLEFGDWEADTEARLSKLRDKMLPFAIKMKMPRNKLLAHDDVTTIIAATELGAFCEDEDVDYFKTLKEFTEIVVIRILGEHFDYDNGVPADIVLFANAFDRGRIGGDLWRTVFIKRNTGFMEGEIEVPDDFDRMGAEEIKRLFGGKE